MIDHKVEWQVTEGCVSCDMNGEKVVLNTKTGLYFGIDGVGARVWECLADTASVDSMVGVLLEEFEVAEELLRKDVGEFVGNLIEQGLVRENAASTQEDPKTES